LQLASQFGLASRGIYQASSLTRSGVKIASQAEYAGSIPVIGSTSQQVRAVIDSIISLLPVEPRPYRDRGRFEGRLLDYRGQVDHGRVTDFGGDDQDLDQAEADQDGPLRAWTTPPQPGTKYQGIKSAELKPRGRTYKTASLLFYGDDPENPSTTRLEIKQCRKILGGYDLDNPEKSIGLENKRSSRAESFSKR
jgi:hypothetical protein